MCSSSAQAWASADSWQHRCSGARAIHSPDCSLVCKLMCDYRRHGRGGEAHSAQRRGKLPCVLIFASLHRPTCVCAAQRRVIGRKLAWEKLDEDISFYDANYPNGFPMIIASDVAYVSHLTVCSRPALQTQHRAAHLAQVLGGRIAAPFPSSRSSALSDAILRLHYGVPVRTQHPH